MPLDLHRLRYLIEVVDRGGFSAAAASLGVAQSALSRHVAELERRYGQPLLHRTGRGVTPTAFAETFLPRMRSLVRDADQLSQEITAARGQVVGRVCLGMLQSLGWYVLTPLLSKAAVHYPHLEIAVRDGFGDHVNFLLGEGHVDLAVLYTCYDEWRADDEFLMSTDFVLVGAACEPPVFGDTCTLADVAKLPLILPAAKSRWRSWVEQVFSISGLTFTVGYEIDAAQAMKDLVCMPGNFGLFSRHFVQRELDAGLVRISTILDPLATRRVVLRHSTRKLMSQGCKIIAGLLRQTVRDQVLAGQIQGASLQDS